MTIKRFPLQLTEEELDEIREAAKKKGMPIYKFIEYCIQKEMKEMEETK